MKNEKIDPSNAKKGYRNLILILLFAVLIILEKKYFLDIVDVSGKSMNPVLSNSDTCIETKSLYQISRYDIVVVHADDSYLIKRVIALPDETIQIKDGKVYVDSKPLADDVGVEIEDAGCAADPIQLGKDEYFVLGDNRNDSKDSRSFGKVKAEDVDGKVLFRIFPLNKMTGDFTIKEGT